jgi:hypothetical protein
MAEFIVWRDVEDADEAEPVEAESPREAAEQWAFECDLESGLEHAKAETSIAVNVRDESGVVTQWTVHGEMTPNYSAIESE